MIAGVVLTMVFVASGRLLSGVLRMNKMSRDYARATLSASSKLDELAATDYAAVSAGSDEDGGFSRTWTVAENTSLHVKNVDLCATWSNRYGATHRARFTLVMAE